MFIHVSLHKAALWLLMFSIEENHLLSHLLSSIDCLSSRESNVIRYCIPPIGLIERHFTPSDRMWFMIVSDDWADGVVVVTLRWSYSKFSSHCFPLISAAISLSMSISCNEFLTFSVSSPKSLELCCLLFDGVGLDMFLSVLGGLYFGLFCGCWGCN